MRDLMSKTLAGSMLGAAMLLSACGETAPANNTAANAEMMNAEDNMMAGTTNDAMMNADAGMNSSNMMANDSNMMAGNNSSMNAAEKTDMMTNDADTNLKNGM